MNSAIVKMTIFYFMVLMCLTYGVIGQNWPDNDSNKDETDTDTDPTWDSNGCNLTGIASSCDPESHHLHCHDSSYDHIHLCIGESISIPNKCQLMTCIHYDGNVVMFRGCTTIVPNEGCYLSEPDNNQLYPDCCPKEVCYESETKKKK